MPGGDPPLPPPRPSQSWGSRPYRRRGTSNPMAPRGPWSSRRRCSSPPLPFRPQHMRSQPPLKHYRSPSHTHASGILSHSAPPYHSSAPPPPPPPSLPPPPPPPPPPTLLARDGPLPHSRSPARSPSRRPDHRLNVPAGHRSDQSDHHPMFRGPDYAHRHLPKSRSELPIRPDHLPNPVHHHPYRGETGHIYRNDALHRDDSDVRRHGPDGPNMRDEPSIPYAWSRNSSKIHKPKLKRRRPLPFYNPTFRRPLQHQPLMSDDPSSHRTDGLQSNRRDHYINQEPASRPQLSSVGPSMQPSTNSPPLCAGARPTFTQTKSVRTTPTFPSHLRASRTRKDDDTSEGNFRDENLSAARVEPGLGTHIHNRSNVGDSRSSDPKAFDHFRLDKTSSPAEGEHYSSSVKPSPIISSFTPAPRNVDQRLPRSERSSLVSLSTELAGKNEALMHTSKLSDGLDSRECLDVSQSAKVASNSVSSGIRCKDESMNAKTSSSLSEGKQYKELTNALNVNLADSSKMPVPHSLGASEVKRMDSSCPNSSLPRVGPRSDDELAVDASPLDRAHLVRREVPAGRSSVTIKSSSCSVAEPRQTLNYDSKPQWPSNFETNIDSKQTAASEPSVRTAPQNNLLSSLPASSSDCHLQSLSNNKTDATHSTGRELKAVHVMDSRSSKPLIPKSNTSTGTEVEKTSAEVIGHGKPPALPSSEFNRNSFPVPQVTQVPSENCDPKHENHHKDLSGEPKSILAKECDGDLCMKSETDKIQVGSLSEKYVKQSSPLSKLAEDSIQKETNLAKYSNSDKTRRYVNGKWVGRNPTTRASLDQVLRCHSGREVYTSNGTRESFAEKIDSNTAEKSVQNLDVKWPDNSFGETHNSITMKNDERQMSKVLGSSFQKSLHPSPKRSDDLSLKLSSSALIGRVGEATEESKEVQISGHEAKLKISPESGRSTKDAAVKMRLQEGSTNRDESDSRSDRSGGKKINELNKKHSNCKLNEVTSLSRTDASQGDCSAYSRSGLAKPQDEAFNQETNITKDKKWNEKQSTLIPSKNDVAKKRRTDERERFRDLNGIIPVVESKNDPAPSSNEISQKIGVDLTASDHGAMTNDKDSISTKIEIFPRSRPNENRIELPSTLPSSHCKSSSKPISSMPMPIPMPAPALTLLRSSPRARARSGGIEGKLNSLTSLLNPSSTPPLRPMSSTPTGEQEKSEMFRNDLLSRIHELEGKIISVERKLAILKNNQTNKVVTLDQEERVSSLELREPSDSDTKREPSIVTTSERWERPRLDLKPDSHSLSVNVTRESKRSLHPVHGNLRLLLIRNQCVAAASGAEFRNLCHSSEGFNAEPMEKIENWQLSAQKLQRVAVEIRRRKRDAIEKRRKLTREYSRLRENWTSRLKLVRDKRSKEKRDAIRERDRFLLLSTRGQHALLTSKTSSGRTTTRVVPSVGWNGASDGSAELDALLTEIETEGGTPGARELWSRTLAKVPNQVVSAKPCDSSVLVENPVADWHASRATNPWMIHEKLIFLDKFIMYPKNFRKIASFLEHKSTQDCAKFYFDNKLKLGIRQLLKESTTLKRKGILRSQIVSIARKHHSSDSGLVLAVTNAGLLQMTDAKEAVNMFLSDKEIQLRDVSRGVKQLHLNMEERGDWGVYPMKVTEKILNEWGGVNLEGIDHALFMQAYRKHGTDWRAIGVMVGGIGKTSGHYREYYRRNCRRIIGEVYTKLMPSKGSKNSGNKNRISNTVPPSKILLTKPCHASSTQNGLKIDQRNRRCAVSVDRKKYKTGENQMEMDTENRDESQNEMEEDEDDVDGEDTESDDAENCVVNSAEVRVESHLNERIRRLGRTVKEDGT